MTVPRNGGATRARVVLAGLVTALLLGATGWPVWVNATAPDLAGTVQAVPVTGSQAAPAVLALALVAAAASLATALSSRWVRLVTAPVLILAGLAAGVQAAMVGAAPEDAARGAVAHATGMTGGELHATATTWPWIALLPASGLVAVGVVVLRVGSRWSTSDRYRSAAAPTGAGVLEDPAAAWDALTRGEDPTDPTADRRRDRTGDVAE